MGCLFSRSGSFVAVLLAGLCLVGCGGAAVDSAEGNGSDSGQGSENSTGRVSAPRATSGDGTSPVNNPQSVFERQLGSVSDGRCEASWKSIGLNRFAQRKQWSAPELRVDCDSETQVLTTETVQNGIPLLLTFVFQRGELLSATHTAFLTADIEFESEVTVERILFEDLSRGRRRIEFEGSILFPEGDPVDARGVGDACQIAVSC